MFGSRKLGAALVCGSLLFGSSVANATATTTAAQAGQWAALSALGTSSSAAAVAQENPQLADPHGYDRSGHGLGASVGLLGLGILLVIVLITLAHDNDNDDEGAVSPF